MKSLKMLLFAALFIPFLSYGQVQTPKPATVVASAKVKPTPTLVRGVSFAFFKTTVPQFADTAKQKALALPAWKLWKAEKWIALEKLFTVNVLNDTFPPNNGAISKKMITIKTGVLVSRYGGWYTPDSVFHDTGKFVCEGDVPFPQRSLQKSNLTRPYSVYKIVKPIPNVNSGLIIPWYGEPGMAKQYLLPYGIDDLKKGGYIVVVKTIKP